MPSAQLCSSYRVGGLATREHRGKPWPRHARAWSVLVLLVGVGMGVGGALVALGRSSTEGLLAVGGLLAVALLGAAAVTWGADRWAGGKPAYPPWVLPVAIAIAVVMFLLARSDVAGPVGVAMLGGGLVGTMVGNLRAISRHGD